MYKALVFDFAGVIWQGENPDGSVSLNQELLTFLRPLKEQYQLSIFTNSFHILNTPSCHSAVSTLFHRIFFAKKLNWPKSEPESYLSVAKELKIEPSEMIFTDDATYNVLAAQQAGVTALHYQSNHELFEQVQPLIGL